jgi:hypothetical protein
LATLPVGTGWSKPSELNGLGISIFRNRRSRKLSCALIPHWRNSQNVPLLCALSVSFLDGFEIASPLGEEKMVMEMVLIITLVSWAVVGVNLLFTYDKNALADAR